MKMIRLFVVFSLLIILLSSCSWLQKKDDRTVLTKENYINLSKPITNCDELGFNINPPNTTGLYSNAKIGLSFDVPYNSSWGNEAYKLTPYEEYPKENYVWFGRVGQVYPKSKYKHDGCIYREYRLRYKLGLDSTTKVIDSLKYFPFKETGSSELIPINAQYDVEPQVVSIGELKAVKFWQSADSNCPTGSLIVIGKKASYELSGVCTFEETFKELENIAKTFRFIE